MDLGINKNRKILITSALPYVNNIPHLGNIIGCVLSADVFAKYCKIAGYNYLYICGTDEYGTTTIARAKEENLSPKEICDKYHKIHKEVYDWFNIDFSYFGRTSSEKQTEIVQEIFLDLYKAGYIKEDVLKQPYCENDKMFLADRFIEGTCPHCNYEKAKGDQCENCGKLLDPIDLKNPKCSLCGNTPVFKETKHLFLDLEKIKPKLEDWVNKTSVKGEWSNNAISLTKGWIEQGLKKRCITRDIEWGVKVPLEGFENKVFYVWFDAPIGYISITACKFDDWEKWWKNPDEVELFQFMGKDNIPFHTVLFPSSLIGTGKNWTLLKTISSTEYLNYEDLKFSKSRGTGVFGDQAKETGIDADLYRYYLLRIRPEKNDTQFFWQDFMEKVNGEIIANYGNLVNRVMQFLIKNYEGKVEINFDVLKSDFYGYCDFENRVKNIVNLFEKIELKKALLEILELCSYGNKYFQDNQPWALINIDKNKTYKLLISLLCFVKDITILLYPYIPKTVIKLFRNFNLDESYVKLENIGNNEKLNGLKIEKADVLFTKLEKDQIEKLKIKYSGGINSGNSGNSGNEKSGIDNKVNDKKINKENSKKENSNNVEKEITAGKDHNIENKIRLVTGKIIEIKRHPQADKLYIEKIDLGNGDVRQIVSGLVGYYKEEELLNKTVIVVANLKPAKLRGELSEGMILAGEENGVVEVLMPEVDKGKIVTVENGFAQDMDNYTKGKDEITIDDFAKIDFKVIDSICYMNDKKMVIDDRVIKLNKVKNGKIR